MNPTHITRPAVDEFLDLFQMTQQSHIASTRNPLNFFTTRPDPVVEYWGIATLDHTGTAVISLPGYFEAQTAPGGRSVLLTSEGSVGAQLSYEPIIDGRLTVHGTAGATFSWLVKAVRIRIVLGVDSGAERVA
ncbi:hypothetical protein D7Z96_01660 [Pseudarthrobacter phenanthrenivorans]|uniref:Uncharacterized protein n=1 Tax=Pseudarthrobacter phenanthrenivorans TaxID=361575 RepID=A0A3B0FRU6_PSEPS|nr:hypothetical protein [Pseudarthrobacter phenanthrenivorans]RKO27654.1 hypothetical protein D7Z96_01660 [Pseudarthrobacter phenanthrenivorans]